MELPTNDKPEDPIEEALEDYWLGLAIEEGLLTEPVDIEEVFKLLRDDDESNTQ